MAYTRLSDANEITARYMDSILIQERLIDSVVANTTTTLLGETFDSPVLTPAFSHLKNYDGRELTGLEEYSVAAKESNILNFVGMMENDQFKKILATGAKTVRIVKPYADNAKVRDQFKFAEDNGAFGIGMDIDHIFGMSGYDICVGEEMAAQTQDICCKRSFECSRCGKVCRRWHPCYHRKSSSRTSSLCSSSNDDFASN